jgi:hypothetical protein
MPGKVNPVIPEVMNQVAFEVIGNDVTVTMAAEAGQLQLNAFEPIMGAQPVQEHRAPRRRLPHAEWGQRKLRGRHHRQPPLHRPPSSRACAWR